MQTKTKLHGACSMNKAILHISYLLFIFLYSCKEDKIIFSNPGYTEGIIGYYEPNHGSSSVINFYYYVNGAYYYTQYSDSQNGWSVPTSGSYKKGDKYMVQYDAGNPNNARFLFNYPISDTTDYINDVNQFKAHPPGCCFVNLVK